MEPKGRGKQIGDKELELMVLSYVANHDSPKESEICKNLPANNMRIVRCLRSYVDARVLELIQDNTSYTTKRYTLTDFGEFCLSMKEIDCSITHGSFKVVRCGNFDLEGKDFREVTRILKELKKK